MSKEFNTKTILNAITDYSDEGETLENIQEYAFNTDPWIIMNYQASEALKDFDEQDQLYEKTDFDGVFGAIQYVQDFENDAFGKVYTNISDPGQLASGVARINGEQVICKLADKLGLGLDDELTEQQAKQLSSVESMQELLKK